MTVIQNMRQSNKKLASSICNLTRLGNKVLSLDELKSYVPSLFQTSRCLATTKGKYQAFNTSDFIEYMASNNFYPVAARQQNIRNIYDKETKQLLISSQNNVRQGYQRHCIAFKNFEYAGQSELQPTIYLVNSHDGRSSFQVFAGIFRVVCSNGLIVSDGDIQQIRLNHYQSMIDVKKAVNDLFDRFTIVFKSIDKMKTIQVSEEQKITMAKFAASLRDNKSNKLVDTSELLRINRKEDRGNDLWTLLNIVQENLIHGNTTVINTSTNKERKAREVTSISSLLDLNTSLWQETLKMAA